MAEGPGVYVDDLETGLQVMVSYRKQCADIEARRADLAAAEKLFDLPISVCSRLCYKPLLYNIHNI